MYNNNVTEELGMKKRFHGEDSERRSWYWELKEKYKCTLMIFYAYGMQKERGMFRKILFVSNTSYCIYENKGAREWIMAPNGNSGLTGAG